MCVMNLQKNSLLCLTQKTFTVFSVCQWGMFKKKGCSWQVQGETEWYRSKCTCTNTSNMVPEVIKYFFVIIQALFYLLIIASATFISIPVTAFPFSRNLSSSCCFELLFMFINLRLSECRNKDELLKIIWDCWMPYLLLFKTFGICSCKFLLEQWKFVHCIIWTFVESHLISFLSVFNVGV